MKGADRYILVIVPLLALAIGFWLLVLSPKQKEANELQTRIDSLQSTIAASESQAAVAEQARATFPRNYADLVRLGAAVPEDDDQATLIHDLAELGRRDAVNFRSFEVSTDAAAAATPPPPPTSTAPSATDVTATSTTTGAAAAPTEAAAAVLPLGAAVGPAGLPVTPYSLTYFGGFFDMADLFADLDAQVKTSDAGGKPIVRGRLMTIDAFSFSPDPIKGFPRVQASLDVTTYLVPAEQGISAGATPAGPAPVATTDPTTVSTGTTSPAGTTAAVTP